MTTSHREQTTSRAASASTSASTESHLVVDWTRCDGHGLCAVLSGGAITLDDWGFPILPNHQQETAARNVPANTELESKTQRRIVSLCPSLALRMEQNPPPTRTKENSMSHPTRPQNGAPR